MVNLTSEAEMAYLKLAENGLSISADCKKANYFIEPCTIDKQWV